MKSLTIDSKKEQPLLHRTEVSGTVLFEGATPSRISLLEDLGKKLQVNPEVLSLQHIHNAFGSQKAQFMAYTYKTAEAKKKYETVLSHLKKKDQKEKKAEAK